MLLKKISEIKLNPNNPRLIKDDKFEKLVKSIKEFPEMLELRPIVVNSDMIILVGNMRYKANQEEKNHPTQKPQEIMQWCFEYADRHSKNEIKLVLDVYLGSGSTMVASHQLKRKCYGMELDPKYCDVIVKRMKKLDPALIIKRNGVVTNDFE